MENYKIKDICFYLPKSSIKASNGLKNGKYPFFTSSNTQTLWLDEYNYDNECLIIGTGGSASCNYFKGKFATSTDNFVISSNDVDVKYLYYFLNYDNMKLLQNGFHGAGLQHISKEYFNAIELIIPELSVQRNIVKYLDVLNELINKDILNIRKLNEIIKSRFIEMFGRVNNTKYETSTINELCEFVKDGTHQTPTYTEDVVNGYKFLSSKDVTSGKIDWTNIKYIPADLHDKLYKTIKPQRNDILLAKNGTTGTAALVECDDIFDIYVSLALLRFKNKNNPKYMLYAINNEDTKEQFDNNLVGVGVPNLHLGRIKETKLIVPPMELQNQFVEFVEQIDKSKFNIQKRIELYKELLNKKMYEFFG